MYNVVVLMKYVLSKNRYERKVAMAAAIVYEQVRKSILVVLMR